MLCAIFLHADLVPNTQGARPSIYNSTHNTTIAFRANRLLVDTDSGVGVVVSSSEPVQRVSDSGSRSPGDDTGISGSSLDEVDSIILLDGLETPVTVVGSEVDASTSIESRGLVNGTLLGVEETVEEPRLEIEVSIRCALAKVISL